MCMRCQLWNGDRLVDVIETAGKGSSEFWVAIASEPDVDTELQQPSYHATKHLHSSSPYAWPSVPTARVHALRSRLQHVALNQVAGADGFTT